MHFGSTKWIVIAYSTGIYIKTGQDSRLTMPPLKPSSSEDRYDSVHGITHSTSIYIVYDHDKSYPAYLIT